MGEPVGMVKFTTTVGIFVCCDPKIGADVGDSIGPVAATQRVAGSMFSRSSRAGSIEVALSCRSYSRTPMAVESYGHA